MLLAGEADEVAAGAVAVVDTAEEDTAEVEAVADTEAVVADTEAEDMAASRADTVAADTEVELRADTADKEVSIDSSLAISLNILALQILQFSL